MPAGPSPLYPWGAVALAPLLLWQGQQARRGTPVLPEPPGAREGVAGQGPPLRLLVLGDSAAAGVGATSQDEALLGRLVGELARERAVQYRLLATSGHTSLDAVAALRTLGAMGFDTVVTSLGANDLTEGIRREEWRQRLRAVVALCQGPLGARFVLLSGMPPFHGFPALPQPLRWALGERARRFDQDIAQVAGEHDGCEHLPLRFDDDPGRMASDGYHPGPGVYAQWARDAAGRILARA